MWRHIKLLSLFYIGLTVFGNLFPRTKMYQTELKDFMKLKLKPEIQPIHKENKWFCSFFPFQPRLVPTNYIFPHKTILKCLRKGMNTHLKNQVHAHLHFRKKKRNETKFPGCYLFYLCHEIGCVVWNVTDNQQLERVDYLTKLPFYIPTCHYTQLIACINWTIFD